MSSSCAPHPEQEKSLAAKKLELNKCEESGAGGGELSPKFSEEGP